MQYGVIRKRKHRELLLLKTQLKCVMSEWHSLQCEIKCRHNSMIKSKTFCSWERICQHSMNSV
jgi:hypothetical protein